MKFNCKKCGESRDINNNDVDYYNTKKGVSMAKASCNVCGKSLRKKMSVNVSTKRKYFRTGKYKGKGKNKAKNDLLTL
jgi:transcription elongation factor Elf1